MSERDGKEYCGSCFPVWRAASGSALLLLCTWRHLAVSTISVWRSLLYFQFGAARFGFLEEEEEEGRWSLIVMRVCCDSSVMGIGISLGPESISR
jgi:hypothetical protein